MLIIWENIFKMCWCVCKYLLSSVTLFLFPLSLSTSIPLFQSLSLAERKELLEAWVEQKEHCPTIMAQVSWSPDQHHQGHHLHHLPHLHLPPHQVSGCSFRDALELTRHAESLGVAAIGNIIIAITMIILTIKGVLPNLFPRPRSVGELVDWCRLLPF